MIRTDIFIVIFLLSFTFSTYIAAEDIQEQNREQQIAEKLALTVDADEIIVLKEGEIVEQGNHQKLLAIKGKYFAMWQHQSGGFLQ